MNDYLKLLNSKLKKLPEHYKKEILEDYKNHFKEGLLTGKNENDIISELGDIDYIVKNIIAEYYVENSEKVTNVKKILKAVSTVVNVGIGSLNLLLITPLIGSALVFIISLYILDLSLFITPLLLIINLMLPNLPIHFGTEILWLKIIFVLISVTIGYLLYKTLNKHSVKFFRWVFRYIIKSVKFQAINIKI